MKIVCISDTHDKHEDLLLPDGDVLIHAGDATMTGTKQQLSNFLHWIAKQPHKHKIWIAGNHDWGMDKDQTAYELWCGRRGRWAKEIDEIRKEMEALSDKLGLIYLNNSDHVIDGVVFYGSPETPAFYGWAFNRTLEELYDHWAKIPDDVNVLITHGPAFGVLDQLEDGRNAGDIQLFNRICDLEKLKLHVCGHIHPGHGKTKRNELVSINGSILNDAYQIANKPIVFNLETK